jgi:HlyD family secretion protein
LLKSPGKWIAALIVVALGVTGVSIFLALRPSSSNPQTTNSPSPSPSTRSPNTISALGRLEPGGEVYCVYPPSSSGFGSVLKQWRVKEGDSVKQNDVIAVMDTYDRLFAAGIQAEAKVREAEAKVRQVEAGTGNQAQVAAQQEQVNAKIAQVNAKQAEVLRRDAEFKNARSELNRYEQLFRDGGISASERDRRALDLQTAYQALEQSVRERQQLEREVSQSAQTQSSLTQARPEDVQQAVAQRDVAVADLERAKVDLETAAVRAPITGRVLKINAKAAEQVSSGVSGNSSSQTCSGIAELGRTDQMYAVAEVYETDITKVRKGQKATITSAAFPEKISGTIEQVGLRVGKKDVLDTDPAADTDARVVEVRIRLSDSKPVAGLTNLQVNVAIAP